MTTRVRDLVFLICAIAAAQAAAQSHRAAVRGAVVDQDRRPLAGATVALTRDDTDGHRQVETGDDGGFIVAEVEPGVHRLEVARDGFKRHIERLVLRVNQDLRIDIVLEPGPVTEVVDVVAPRPTPERDSAALATTLENRQIAQLPLDGRNFLELSLLAPGTAPAAQGSAGSVRGEFAMHVNGAREDANAFLLDGVYNIDPKLNGFGVQPPVDAVEEFKVLTSTYDASFGRNAGGQVNVVLKSGTNEFAGTLYEFFRDDALNARNAMAPRGEPAPEYRRHQFGGSLGGPIVPGRTFFFADYEGTRAREGITRITNVPTAAERAGDFSAGPFRPPVNPFTQRPFPGDRIPDALIDPVGRALAALYPLPNRAATLANYVSSPVQTDRNDLFDGRVDHRFGSGGQFTVRYSFSDRDLYEPFSGPGFAAVPGFGTNVARRAQNLAVSDTRVLSSTLVNEVRVGYSRVAAGAFHENLGRSLNGTVGLPEPSDNPRDWGLSFVRITGYSPLGDEYNNPQHSVTDGFQVLDTLTYAAGRHLVKAGIEVRAVRQDAYRDVNARGLLNFSDRISLTGHPLADLLLGYPLLTGAARVDNPQRLRTETVGLFVHDHVSLTPTLTLSAGVRYELTSPPVDRDDRANLYDPATQSLVRVGTGGLPRAGYETDLDNLAPRLALAWAADRAGRTVLRGGYGIYYDQSALAPGEGIYFNPPHFDFRYYFPLPGLPLTLSNAFPEDFPVRLPPSALSYQRDLRAPYLHHWNVSVQRQLGANRFAEVAYVASRGRNLLTARDLNQPEASALRPNPRPIPAFDDITVIESRGRSRYDSLQLRYQQRFDRDWALLASYTWGRSQDHASSFFVSGGDANFPQNSLDPGAEWARSSFDVRHRLSVGFTWDLPFGPGRRWLAGPGWAPAVFGGWQTHGVATFESGRPLTVALLPELDNSNTGRSILGFGANDRPNLVGDPAVSEPTAERWFDPGAFELPPFGTFGNAGRNGVEGPGYANVNLSVTRTFRLAAGTGLQVRLEAFNLFNRVNYGLPDGFFGSPTFAQVLSAGSPRRLQLGLKLLF